MTFSRLNASGIAGVVGSLCLVVGDGLITPSVVGDRTLIEIRASIGASRLYGSGLHGVRAVLRTAYTAWSIQSARHRGTFPPITGIVPR